MFSGKDGVFSATRSIPDQKQSVPDKEIKTVTASEAPEMPLSTAFSGIPRNTEKTRETKITKLQIKFIKNTTHQEKFITIIL